MNALLYLHFFFFIVYSLYCSSDILVAMHLLPLCVAYTKFWAIFCVYFCFFITFFLVYLRLEFSCLVDHRNKFVDIFRNLCICPGSCCVRVTTKSVIDLYSVLAPVDSTNEVKRLWEDFNSRTSAADSRPLRRGSTADNQQSSGEEKGGCSFDSACRGVDVVPRPATNEDNPTEAL